MVAEILTFRVGIAEFRYEQSSDVIHFLYFQKYWLQTSWYFICYKRNHQSLNFDVPLPSQQLLATVKLAIWVRFCYFVARELATIVLFQKKYRRTSICLATIKFYYRLSNSSGYLRRYHSQPLQFCQHEQFQRRICLFCALELYLQHALHKKLHQNLFHTHGHRFITILRQNCISLYEYDFCCCQLCRHAQSL